MPRLAVLADVHLSTPADQFPGQDLSYAPDLLRQTAKMLDDDRPDGLCVVGDLTNFGTDGEYGLAREIFGSRLDGCLAVAGNHETVRGKLADFERHMNRPPARFAEFAGVPFLLLNTAIDGQDPHYWHGRLDDESLRLADDIGDDGPLVVVLHHPLPGTVRVDNGHPMMTAINGGPLRDRLATRRGQTVVFSGHAHLPDVQRIGRVTYVGCPPLAFWPHGYLLCDFDGGSLDIATKRLSINGTPDPSATTQAYRDHREPPVESLALRL